MEPFDRLTCGGVLGGRHVTGQPVAKQSVFVQYVCIIGPTLQFGIHGDVREAAQHSHDLIILLLPQEPQHAASVRVLETHQVLEAPNFILERGGQMIHRYLARQYLSSSFFSLYIAQVQSMCMCARTPPLPS